MKIGVPNDRRPNVVEYWEFDGSVANLTELEMLRPWSLHVVKFSKACNLGSEQVEKIASVCRGKPWILDMDEDYLSTQNPFAVHFRHSFGNEAFVTLKNVHDATVGDDEEYSQALEGIVSQGLHLLSASKYQHHETVQAAVSQLLAGKHKKRTACEMLASFRDLCSTVVQAGDEELLKALNSPFDSDFLITSGRNYNLPHHISTLPEILRLLRNTQELLNSIHSAPGVVTVATSRADEYTPEAQAVEINEMVLDMLSKQWSISRTVQVSRRDFRTNLSIDSKEDSLKNLALFLSNGKKEKLGH